MEISHISLNNQNTIQRYPLKILIQPQRCDLTKQNLNLIWQGATAKVKRTGDQKKYVYSN